MQGCLAALLPAVGVLLCCSGCLLAMNPFIGFFGWPFALIGSLMVWLSRISSLAKVLLGLVPLLFPLIWYWYLLMYVVH